jgi:hypothetical protein
MTAGLLIARVYTVSDTAYSDLCTSKAASGELLTLCMRVRLVSEKHILWLEDSAIVASEFQSHILVDQSL